MEKAEKKEPETTAAVTITEDYAVVVADKEGLLEFFKNKDDLDTLYTVIEKKAKGLVADVTTKEGRSQIKSAARQIASVKTKIEDLGKNVVAELKALPKFIDANRKNLREKLEALQEEIRRPVTEIEERQKAIEDIGFNHVNLANAGTADIDRAIKALEEVPLTEDKWKESLEDAITAVKCETNALKLLRDAAAKKEEGARRLAELEAKQAEAERIIREQKIREEAEHKAKEEAEARAAAEKARLEREKEEAERRAAEAERKAKEAEPAAAEGTQQAVMPMPKPSKWTPEMKAVNKAILDTFAKTIEAEVKKVIVGFTESGYKVAAENTAKALVSAIIKGEIKNLKVEY